MKQTAIQFSLALFVITILVNIYTAWFHGNAIVSAAMNGVAAGVLVGAAGTAGYLFGITRHGAWPPTKSVLLHAAHTYFLSYVACSLFGLFAVSWFIFVGVVAVLGLLTGWRLAAPKETEAAANQ